MEAPREAPRLHFFSLTFLVAFGLGSFVGVALALVAVVLADPQRTTTTTTTVEIPSTETPAPGSTATPAAKARTKTALEVRLGPGDAYAIVGQLGKGEAIDPVGRDSASEWLAIRFPPGSAARGWVEISDVEGLTNTSSLAVVVPTPLPRTISTFPPSFGGSGGTGGGSGVDDEPTLAPGAPTRTPSARTGPVDLTIRSMTLLDDGRVQVVIGNTGPGDLTNVHFAVSVRDLLSNGEVIQTTQDTLRAGGTLTIRTQLYRVTRESEVTSVADVYASVNDPDRTNNSQTQTLAPPPTPIAPATTPPA